MAGGWAGPGVGRPGAAPVVGVEVRRGDCSCPGPCCSSYWAWEEVQLGAQALLEAGKQAQLPS